MKSRLLAFLCVLALFPAGTTASQPTPPAGVAPEARFFGPTRVWVLEAGGKQIVWYENGTKKAEGNYERRMREGAWIFWYDNGNKKGEGEYRSSKREGHWKLYHRNGAVHEEGLYRADRREGEWIVYFESGKVEARGPYRAGEKHGDWVGFYEDGTTFVKGPYDSGMAHGRWTYFFAAGQPYQEGEYRRDLRVGEWKICIQPGGPCGRETFESGRTPRTMRLDEATIAGTPRPENDPSNPGAVLDSLDKGGVPEDVPPAVREGWND